MHVFYVSPQQPDRLSEAEARHCLDVLRFREGDVIHTVDGTGQKYTARIASIQKKSVNLELLEIFEDWGEPQVQTHLLFAPLRIRDRQEWLLEKAMELGVTALHPVLCTHSERKQDPQKRWMNVLISALKQCLRSRLPELHALVPFAEAVNRLQEMPGVLATCTAVDPPDLVSVVQRQSELVYAIGPEGDFTPAELEQVQTLGWQIVSLGQTRLRSETAALYLLSLNKWLRLEATT